MPIAQPTPLAPELYWLEPETFVSWRRRVELESRVGHLTRARRDALRALIEFHGPEGLFPSDATVAERAGCSVSTVKRARADARELGLLTWEKTRKLVAGRWVQGSNRYDVRLPSTLVSDAQADRQSQARKKRGLIEAPSILSDAQARQNAARQVAALLAMMETDKRRAAPAVRV